MIALQMWYYQKYTITWIGDKILSRRTWTHIFSKKKKKEEEKKKSKLNVDQPSTKNTGTNKNDILHPKTEKKPQWDGRKDARVI